ncbi:MAG: adenylate/guanylate cyclase domain-containing protein [Desulfosalsimonas sp.]
MKWHFGHKLALVMTALVLIASCILGYSLVHRQFVLLEKQFAQTGTMLASQLSAGSVEGVFTEDELGLASLVNSLNENLSVAAAALVSRDNEILAHAGRDLPMYQIEGAGAFQTSGSLSGHGDIVWFYAPVVFQNVVGATAWVGLDRSELAAGKNRVVYSGGIVVALLVLTITLAAIRLGRSLGKPVNDMIQGAEAISSGNYGFRMQDHYKGEFAALADAFNCMAADLEQKLRVERTFSRFVSNPVAARYMDKEPSDLGREGCREEASVLFADLSGYTEFSQSRSPEEIARILNLYFARFAEICHNCNGNVDKYIGDCAMMVFGCPQPDKDHRYNAMTCALQIQQRIAAFNEERRRENLPCLDVRVGISSGIVLAGLFGSRDRLQYTVVGQPANLAARLCDLADAGQILIDREFYQHVSARFPVQAHTTRRIQVKGFSNGVEVMIVKGWMHWSDNVDVFSAGA